MSFRSDEVMSSTNNIESKFCEICGKVNDLFRCSKCKLAWYCSRSHQQLHWKAHRASCLKDDGAGVALFTDMAKENHDRILELASRVVEQLQTRGYCIVDNFLGSTKAFQIQEEVKSLNSRGMFVEGQLSVSSTSQNIRGDKITWVDGSEDGCQNIFDLIRMLDCLITVSKDNFKKCNIRGRTKAMVACYPGNGAGYKYHVDNPSGDGRSITALYYLNEDWKSEVHGGMLRMLPELEGKEIFVDPILDRLLLFWSDRRNPHQVEPSYKIRYAITVWYFDADERSAYFDKYMRRSDVEGECDSNSVSSSLGNSAMSFTSS